MPSSKETTPSPAALMQSIAQSQAHRIDRIRPATTTANPVRDFSDFTLTSLNYCQKFQNFQLFFVDAKTTNQKSKIDAIG